VVNDQLLTAFAVPTACQRWLRQISFIIHCHASGVMSHASQKPSEQDEDRGLCVDPNIWANTLARTMKQWRDKK